MRSASITVLVVSAPDQKSGTVSGCFEHGTLESLSNIRNRRPFAKRDIHIVVARRHREATRNLNRLTRGPSNITGKMMSSGYPARRRRALERSRRRAARRELYISAFAAVSPNHRS